MTEVEQSSATLEKLREELEATVENLRAETARLRESVDAIHSPGQNDGGKNLTEIEPNCGET